MIPHARYAIRALARLRLEGVASIVSASVALAGLAVAYALASSVDRNVSNTIAVLRQRSGAWVVPPNGFVISDATGALRPRAAFGAAPARHIRESAHKLNLQIIPLRVVERQTPDGGFAVYYLETQSRQRVSYDRATVKRLALAPVLNELGPVQLVPSNIGAALVLVEGHKFTPESEQRVADPDWFLMARASVDDVREELIRNGVKVHLAYGSEAFAGSEDADCIIAIFERAPTARFSPFSLSTELSAYVVNTVLGTRIGLLARAAFVFTLALTIMSARTAVRARRNEIAVFSMFGLEGDLAAIFGIEAALTSLISLVGGSAVAATFLLAVVGMAFRDCAGALALATVFAVILCLVDALTRALACAATFQRRDLDSYA